LTHEADEAHGGLTAAAAGFDVEKNGFVFAETFEDGVESDDIVVADFAAGVVPIGEKGAAKGFGEVGDDGLGLIEEDGRLLDFDGGRFGQLCGR